MPSFWIHKVLLMSSAAHWFGQVELWIFVLIFSTASTWRQQQQIFDIQNLTHPNWWAAEDSTIVSFKYVIFGQKPWFFRTNTACLMKSKYSLTQYNSQSQNYRWFCAQSKHFNFEFETFFKLWLINCLFRLIHNYIKSII